MLTLWLQLVSQVKSLRSPETFNLCIFPVDGLSSVFHLLSEFYAPSLSGVCDRHCSLFLYPLRRTPVHQNHHPLKPGDHFRITVINKPVLVEIGTGSGEGRLWTFFRRRRENQFVFCSMTITVYTILHPRHRNFKLECFKTSWFFLRHFSLTISLHENCPLLSIFKAISKR